MNFDTLYFEWTEVPDIQMKFKSIEASRYSLFFIELRVIDAYLMIIELNIISLFAISNPKEHKKHSDFVLVGISESEKQSSNLISRRTSVLSQWYNWSSYNNSLMILFIIYVFSFI